VGPKWKTQGREFLAESPRGAVHSDPCPGPPWCWCLLHPPAPSFSFAVTPPLCAFFVLMMAVPHVLSPVPAPGLSLPHAHSGPFWSVESPGRPHHNNGEWLARATITLKAPVSSLCSLPLGGFFLRQRKKKLGPRASWGGVLRGGVTGRGLLWSVLHFDQCIRIVQDR
jgi:hypothetical protein